MTPRFWTLLAPGHHYALLHSSWPFQVLVIVRAGAKQTQSAVGQEDDPLNANLFLTLGQHQIEGHPRSVRLDDNETPSPVMGVVTGLLLIATLRPTLLLLQNL